MSGTRSGFPTAQAIEAVIVAHGQPSDPARAEAETRRLADRVQAFLPGSRVRGVTLATPGALDAALASARKPPIIYPLFMSDGWFSATELPRRLTDRAARLLPPLGLDAGLADLACADITARAARRGWPTAKLTLVLAAHGSGRSDTSARAVRAFSGHLERRLRVAEIRIGYVEQSPTVCDAATGVGPRAVCLPFFAAKGGHVTEDLPAALRRAGFGGELADPIGTHPGIAAVIAERLCAAASAVPAGDPAAVRGRSGPAVSSTPG